MAANVEERRIFELIEAERKERRTDITEIHARIDRLPDEIIKRLPRMDENASWVRQSIGLSLAVITILGFMLTIIVAITKPISHQQETILNRLRHHVSLEGHSKALEKQAKTMERLYDLREDVNKLEDWKEWMQREKHAN